MDTLKLADLQFSESKGIQEEVTKQLNLILIAIEEGGGGCGDCMGVGIFFTTFLSLFLFSGSKTPPQSGIQSGPRALQTFVKETLN